VEVSHKGLTDPSRPEYPTGNQVVGNFIGTDVTGKRDPGYSYNDSRGVVVEDGAKSTVVRENVIGNNKGYGIYIRNHDTTDTLVYDNRIGVSRSGAAVSNGFAGVRIEAGANRSRIGPDNVIANNPVGIRTSDAESDSNTITRNSIYRNDELGIDLEPIETVNASDPGDADTGANQQLNSPVLTSALKRADRPAVIRGTACAGCTVEVFRADTDARTYGEGKTFVGSAVSEADGAFVVYVRVGRGRYVTATATDTEGNTSEFSRNLVVSRN
jgi:hypothetical protein